ncbi:glucokinase [Uncinocarpus reesii 1704]|uniref:Phosphotransferase n=1 Tax=Uncinocarpus reesii (strain UAMH 1704) TaxID=336963 RepID=C4JPB7_UNCRE|nr:glucokinase [Uncinocarpus reesii 1704]EEP79653.1 glucokinase [Uncinocarpus reesii 1704]
MSSSSDPPVIAAAKQIAAEFEYSSVDVNRGVKEFLSEMETGLTTDGSTLSQIPSYITSVPDGSEKGVYLAVDLGGTNIRVCSINLNGDSTFKMIQNKDAIPQELMVTKAAAELFGFIAEQIEHFLQEHHGERYASHVEKRKMGETDAQQEDVFDLGFTFSFPVFQTAINRGTLFRWTKGFDIPEAVGQDVCQLLQDAIDRRHLPVRVAALINDTVGTLMARSYCSQGRSKALIGAIFGTGTNGAYVEKLARVKKLENSAESAFDTTTGEMVINTEWGSFDNPLKVLPDTGHDQELDRISVNPGVQMFEKRVSGMFLGEILRCTIIHMTKNPSLEMCGGPAVIPPDSALYKNWGIDTKFLSTVEGDSTEDLQQVKKELKSDLGLDHISTTDCKAIKILTHAIGKRAARLSAVPLAAIIISSGRLATDEPIDIGVDGSLVEFYPGYEKYIREAWREVPEIGETGEKRIQVGIAKDGSGVGAALGALVARQAERRKRGQ